MAKVRGPDCHLTQTDSRKPEDLKNFGKHGFQTRPTGFSVGQDTTTKILHCLPLTKIPKKRQREQQGGGQPH